jgi:hypothetical protein
MLKNVLCMPCFSMHISNSLNLSVNLHPTDRPKYRKGGSFKHEASSDKDEPNIAAESAEKQHHHGRHKPRRVLQRSKTFMETIQRLRPIQV